MPTYVRGYGQYSVPTGYQSKSLVRGACNGTTGNMQCSYNALVATPSVTHDTTTDDTTTDDTTTNQLISVKLVSNYYNYYDVNPYVPFLYYFSLNGTFYGPFNTSITFTDISSNSYNFPFIYNTIIEHNTIIEQPPTEFAIPILNNSNNNYNIITEQSHNINYYTINPGTYSVTINTTPPTPLPNITFGEVSIDNDGIPSQTITINQ